MIRALLIAIMRQIADVYYLVPIGVRSAFITAVRWIMVVPVAVLSAFIFFLSLNVSINELEQLIIRNDPNEYSFPLSWWETVGNFFHHIGIWMTEIARAILPAMCCVLFGAKIAPSYKLVVSCVLAGAVTVLTGTIAVVALISDFQWHWAIIRDIIGALIGGWCAVIAVYNGE